MTDEDSKNLREIKELLQSIDKKTSAYMLAKLEIESEDDGYKSELHENQKIRAQQAISWALSKLKI